MKNLSVPKKRLDAIFRSFELIYTGQVLDNSINASVSLQVYHCKCITAYQQNTDAGGAEIKQKFFHIFKCVPTSNLRLTLTNIVEYLNDNQIYGERILNISII